MRLPVRLANLPAERRVVDDIHDAAFEAAHRSIVGEGAPAWFDPQGTCLVYEGADARVLGFVYVVTSEDELADADDAAGEELPLPRVDDLFVHPSAQGQGIGSALLSAAEALVGHVTLNLAVLEADVRVREFYRKRGWVPGARFVCSVDGAAYLHASKPCNVKPSAAKAGRSDGHSTPEERFTLEELLEPGARGAAFCQRLHSSGYAIVSLDEAAAAEVSSLRAASAAFFAQPACTKRLVTGESENAAGEGVGYRHVPDKASEFLETFLDERGAAHPPALAAHPELAELAASVHRRLMGAARALLALCVAQLRLPPEAALEALLTCDLPAAREPSASATGTGDRSSTSKGVDPNVGVGDGSSTCGERDAGGAAAVRRTHADADADAAAVSSTLLRICHYHAAAASEASAEHAAAEATASASAGTAPEVLFLPHTDSTLLTLSPLCAASPGLQLQTGRQVWLDVECGASASRLDVEVHAGDYLASLSRGHFFAMRHRVVRHGGGQARVSCPLLLRPRDDWRRGQGWLKYTEDDSDSDATSSATDAG